MASFWTLGLRASSVRRLILTLSTSMMSLVALAAGARAEDIIFTIDPALSTNVWSGSNGTYGSYVPQSSGSLSAPVSGHFLVRFDPLSGTPSSLQFIGGHGYYQVASPHTLSPGVGGSGPPAAANVGGKTAGDEVFWAVRNLVWDFSSPTLAGSGGVFPATTTSFSVLSGGMDFPGGTNSYLGSSDELTAGTWTISQPTSGHWQLDFTGHYDFGDSQNSFRSGGTLVSTAAFGADNVAPVSTSDTQVQALGGSSTVGGVSAEFSGATSGGEFVVQQVPNETGLSQAAVNAAETNPIFALSTESLSVNPQIWNVDFTGSLNGGSATLVFNYDPALLPAGTDPLTLGIWHFNSTTNSWEFGGTVNPTDHTITFVTNSFSPFMLGVQVVPEPSSLFLAALATAGGAAWSRGSRRGKR